MEQSLQIVLDVLKSNAKLTAIFAINIRIQNESLKDKNGQHHQCNNCQP